MRPLVAELSDPELLARFAEARSEAAFAELVRRYVDLVYSAAVRQVRPDHHAAADICQSVFIELSRQASRLSAHPTLSGWLYTTTHHLSARHLRALARRKHREREAQSRLELEPSDRTDESPWAAIAPVLDTAMHGLNEADRTAVLLRCFEHRPFAEIGGRFGISEGAARMRVERALDRLRQQLERRGIRSTASALALALSGQAVAAAPPAQLCSVTAAAFGETGGLAITASLIQMTATQLKTIGLAIVTSAAVVTLTLEHQATVDLETRNAHLENQLAQLVAAKELAEARATRLAMARADEVESGTRAQAELLQLRGQVAVLRNQRPEVSAQGRGIAVLKEELKQLQSRYENQVGIVKDLADTFNGAAPNEVERELASRALANTERMRDLVQLQILQEEADPHSEEIDPDFGRR